MLTIVSPRLLHRCFFFFFLMFTVKWPHIWSTMVKLKYEFDFKITHIHTYNLWHIHWAKLASIRWALQTSLMFSVIGYAAPLQHLASFALMCISIFASLNRGHWQHRESHFRSAPADGWKDFLVLLHQQRCTTHASATKCKLQPFFSWLLVFRSAA